MSIDYRLNEWRLSGEKATEWSQKSYKLLRTNLRADIITGARIGAILYFHHVKGLTASEIRKNPVGTGVPISTIKAILKGFNSRTGMESKEAYLIFMDMLDTEPEMLDRLFDTN
jgi:hypothetical protein